jgi:Skp family chaperone for outer membrane proteins
VDVRRLLIGGAIAAACMIGIAGAARAQNDEAKKPAPAAQSAGTVSQYKIGIVDRRAVLQGYNKVTAERKKLESDVETENKDIDKLSADLQSAKEAYDKERDSLSTTDREEREMALQKQLMEYQTKVQTKQAEVDARERQLMKRFFTDIDDAENYHLIIDGSKGTSTLFFAPAMDMSQKVIDYLNAGSK